MSAALFGGDRIAVEGGVTRMPLTILDIAFPGAGLGGNATGTFAYADAGGGAPTGRADLTVRGLSRAGLVLSSKPIDMGVAAVLSANQLGLRAVMESEGKTIGRAQLRLRAARRAATCPRGCATRRCSGRFATAAPPTRSGG